jgi:hypothetical protein
LKPHKIGKLLQPVNVQSGRSIAKIATIKAPPVPAPLRLFSVCVGPLTITAKGLKVRGGMWRDAYANGLDKQRFEQTMGHGIVGVQIQGPV